MKPARRVFVYVQHLLGIGHLRRAATIANALTSAGMEVTLASGGFPVAGLRLEGVRFIQLPPAASADATFKVLVGEDRRPVDDLWKTARREQLLRAWRDTSAHVLITELYPFGRRQMKFELLSLLEDADSNSKRPVILCSVRDVLGGGRSDAKRQLEMLGIFERYYDGLLVHSDPSVIPFDMSYGFVGRIGRKLRYTGYVVDDIGLSESGSIASGRDEVIVSAGGGAVGMQLLETAIRARPITQLAGRTWRLLCGVNASTSDMERLVQMGGIDGEPGSIVVEKSRPDFSRMLPNCAVSINQGGYNTVLEVVRAGARSVVVPFSAGAELEQTLRAQAFAARGLIEMVRESEMTPQSLAVAIDRVAARPRPATCVDLNGARNTAALVEAWVEDRQS